VLDYKVSNGVCFNVINTGVKVTCTLAFIMYEVISFILYYRPLKEAARLTEASLDRCSTFLTTADQPWDTDSEDSLSANELFVNSISISTSTRSSFELTGKTHKISLNSHELIRRFHRSVQRNFYAGLATISIAFLQGALSVLFDGTDSLEEIGLLVNTRAWYWRSGLGQVVDKGLSVALYISMMVSESNCQRAFIPFICWDGKSWDV